MKMTILTMTTLTRLFCRQSVSFCYIFFAEYKKNRTFATAKTKF